MTTLKDLEGTRWSGRAELWLDPLGNEAKTSDCTIAIDQGVVSYTWSYEGKPQQGKLEVRDDGADFSDSWHQPEPMPCTAVGGSRALLEVLGSYGAGGGPDWGWRTAVAKREPTGELILQMTNIAPWGEEARAVRMICSES